MPVGPAPGSGQRFGPGADAAPGPELEADLEAGPGASGVPAAELALLGTDVRELIDLVADALRALHAVDVAGCPFDAGIGALLSEATERVASGQATVDRFDPPYQRHSPTELLDLVQAGRPSEPSHPTLVHGTARLGHLLVVHGAASEWTDLARSGLGDPYRDLATLAVDLAGTVSGEALGPFVDRYGLDRVDVARLDWHVTLDQLLR